MFPGFASASGPAFRVARPSPSSKVTQVSQVSLATPSESGSELEWDVPSTPNVSPADSQETVDIESADGQKVVVLTCVLRYLPSHILNVLLNQDYSVRGIITCNDSMEAVDALFEYHPNARKHLFIHQVSQLDMRQWERAFGVARYVIHVIRPGTHSEVLDPFQVAEETLKKILAACVRVRTVQRLVLITSVASIAWTCKANSKDAVYTEEHWEDEAHLTGYAKCQLKCEKIAWSFVNSLPESDKFELVVLNPAFMLGPVIQGKSTQTMGLIKGLMESSFHHLPATNLPLVDARDVAHAVAVALVKKRAIGERHILCGGSIWLEEMSDILDKEFTKQGYPVLTKDSCKKRRGLCGILRPYKEHEALKGLRDRSHVAYDNTRMTQVLGIEPRCAEETIIETAYSLIFWDMVTKGHKPGKKTTHKVHYD